MKVDFYDYNGLGYVVDPESDTKIVPVILIGPQPVKCNPRPAVIYVAGGKVDEKYTKLEELKKYCGDNKVVFLCPKADDLNGLAECDVTRSVSKMTEIERRGGKRWDKPKKAEKSRDCGGGKF